MKVITFDDIKKLNISPSECYAWAEAMIANKKNTILPPKISLSSKDGVFFNTMPCILNEERGGGKNCKSLSREKTKLRQQISTPR